MLKYRLYKIMRMFHLISKKKYKKRVRPYLELMAPDYRLIAKSKLFDSKWYLEHNPDVKATGVDPVLHYLNCGWKEDRDCTPYFDGKKYLDAYLDVRNANINPLVHYERFGKNEKRKLYFHKQEVQLTIYEMIVYWILSICKKAHFLSLEKYERLTKRFIYSDYRSIYKSNLFNKKWYCKHYGKDNFVDAIDHYLHIGFKLGYNHSKYFDNDYYLTNNPDILYTNINPLFHYETSGKAEGRNISNANVSVNSYEISYSKNSVLLLSHELSLTGAPIALMNMAKILKSMGFAPIVLSPKNGELEIELQQNLIDYVVEPYLLVKLYRKDRKLYHFLESFSVIVFNTIDTLKYARYLSLNCRKICWVHEGEFGYKCAEACFDVKEAFSYMDEVYSVGSYSKSFTDKYVPVEKSKILLYGIENLRVVPSYKNNDKLTFGIVGVCCERKGTDLFVKAVNNLSENVRKNCFFKVIGQMANNDFCNKLKLLARQENIVFTGQLSHEETLKEISGLDVIVCPSLDDPMPIVCTEAMQLRKVVVCSNRTGTATFIKHGINGFIYDLKKDKLENVINDVYDKRTSLKEVGERWHRVFEKNFITGVFEQKITDLFNIQNNRVSQKDFFELISNIYTELKIQTNQFNRGYHEKMSNNNQ